MLALRPILIAFLCVTVAKAQNTIALPDITNYTKKNYNAGPGNWGFCQDKNGVIYVANDEGLLTFDGNFWKKYTSHQTGTIRSLALAPDGKIYVGSSGEIGYFKPDQNGVLKYTSLNSIIPQGEKDFTEVWNVVLYGDAVFFRSYKRIFQLKDNKITVYKDIAWSFLGQSNGRLIAKAFGKGVLMFQNDNWVPFIKGDTLEERSQIVAFLPLNKDSSLLLTKKHGCYILRGDQLLRYATADIEMICDKNPYGATYVDSSHIAVVTSLGGCFVINKEGRLIQRLEKLDGLQNNNILSVFVDREQNLWLGLGSGIDFIAFNNSIKHIYPNYQELSGGKSAIVFDNKLYIGTLNGLYWAPLQGKQDIAYAKSNFEAVPNTKGQVWNLSEVNGELVMGHNEGFFVIRNNVPQMVDGSSGFWTFIPLSNVMPSPVVMAGTYNGVNFYQYDKGVFRNPSIHAHFESVRFIAMDNDIAWASHPYKGLYKIRINNGINPTYSEYKDKHGIVTGNGNHIFKVKSRIVFTSSAGIYEYDPKTDDFIPSVFLRNIFGAKVIDYLKEDDHGNIWFVENKRLGVVDFSSKTPVIVHFPELNEKILSGGFEYVYAYDQQNIFVAAEEGFYLINYEKYKNQKQSIPILISNVRISNKSDSSIYFGYSNEASGQQWVNTDIPEVSYGWNTLHFEFSAPLYGKQSSMEYAIQLEGLEKSWSPWSRKTEKEYSYLSPGTYTFHVKARTHEGEESVVASYHFMVLPPWYRSTWMYLVYALLLALGLYAIHRYQQNKFTRQQQAHEDERKKLEYLNTLQREKFEEEQKQLMYLHQLELERSKNEIIQLQNDKLESEIQLKNTELASTTFNLIQKGETLLKVKEEFVKMKRVSEIDKESEDYKKILKMLNEDKMKKNWEQFALHFDKVHSDFLVSVKAAYPNLTSSELKLCAYLRLSLSSKEISQIMNITIKSVELARHRLRKKLGIEPHINLLNFLLNFHSELNGNKHEA